MKRSFFAGLYLIWATILFTTVSAFARVEKADTVSASGCVSRLQSSFSRKDIVRFEDPIQQMFYWEQTANKQKYLKPTNIQHLEYAIVPSGSYQLRTAEGASAELIDFLFDENGNYKWIKHPLNQEPKVPHFLAKAEGTIPALYTASRSFGLAIKDNWVTVKAPTDKVHPNSSESEEPRLYSTKLDLRKEVIISVERSNAVAKMDRHFGKDQNFEFLLDPISVADKSTGNGMVFRDLSPLSRPDRYYLPALSLPYVAAEIAKYNSISEFQFVMEFYATATSYAKAMLLLRYGLQMETPNAQNIIIELDKNLRPTGKIFFRDIFDTEYVRSVAEAIGYEDEISFDVQNGVRTTNILDLKWKVSTFEMENYFLFLQSSNSYEKRREVFSARHEDIYVATILAALGLFDLSLEELQKYLEHSRESALENKQMKHPDFAFLISKAFEKADYPHTTSAFGHIYHLQKFLETQNGREALRKWRLSWRQK